MRSLVMTRNRFREYMQMILLCFHCLNNRFDLPFALEILVNVCDAYTIELETFGTMKRYILSYIKLKQWGSIELQWPYMHCKQANFVL